VRDLDAMRLAMAEDAAARLPTSASGGDDDGDASSPGELLRNAALRRDPFFAQLSAQVRRPPSPCPRFALSLTLSPTRRSRC
jgi:hypothetical protein